jgi:DNA replication protein DnaC
MSADAMVTTLKSMKLHGMASAIGECQASCRLKFKQSAELFDKLIKAEVAEREVRSINYQMSIARFPAHRDLAGFDFKDSAINEAMAVNVKQVVA